MVVGLVGRWCVVLGLVVVVGFLDEVGLCLYFSSKSTSTSSSLMMSCKAGSSRLSLPAPTPFPVDIHIIKNTIHVMPLF